MKKNKSGSRIRHVLVRIFNFRSWSDWDRMKSFTLYLYYGIKKFLIPQQSKITESFEEAKTRLNLSDSELKARQNGLLRLCLLMIAIAIALLFYGVYELAKGSALSFFLSLVVMSIALVLAFRYHFWYFQIKKHKLGCTLQEWFRQGIMGDK